MADIDSAQPTVVPSVTYDKWWIETLEQQTVNPSTDKQSANLRVVFRKGRKVDGVWELSEERKIMNVEDVFALAATNPSVAAVLGGLIQVVETLAKQQEVIK